MRKSIWLLVVLVLVFTGCTKHATSVEPERTWTTTDGETLKARWDRTDESNPNVIRLVSNGENYDIDLKDLSKEDQQYIQQARQKKVSKFRKEPAAPQTPATGRKAGDRMVKTVDGVEYAFRWCPLGKFTMGSPSSEEKRDSGETQHEVTLSKGFWMLETEVTVGMWKSFTKDTGYESQGNTPYGWTGSKWEQDSKYSWRNPGFSQDDTHPVVCVSWDDAVEFCKWLSKKTGLKISLPTEAQWEYACRAGTTGPYAGALDAMGWYDDNSDRKTHPVGQKKPNAWGLYDMHGNVWEWCQDWYGDYPSGSVTDPTGPKGGSFRVFRGGSWYGSAQYCRSADRDRSVPDYRGSNVGFRVAWLE